MQLVLEYFTVFEGVLLLHVLCTADGELYIVINTPILLTILNPVFVIGFLHIEIERKLIYVVPHLY